MNKTFLQPLGLAVGLALLVAGVLAVLAKQPILWIPISAIAAGIAITIVSLFYWNLKEKVKAWIPFLQCFKAENIKTIRIERKVKSGLNFRRDMKHEPEKFVFPHVEGMNISPIRNGAGYLLIRGGLASALLYDLELHEVSAQLIINGTPTLSQPIIEDNLDTHTLRVKNSIVLYAENRNGLSNFRMYLSEEERISLMSSYERNVAVEAVLQITGFDKKLKKHTLKTEQSLIALTDG